MKKFIISLFLLLSIGILSIGSVNAHDTGHEHHHNFASVSVDEHHSDDEIHGETSHHGDDEIHGEASHHGDESHGSSHGHHGVEGSKLPIWSVLPFVGILLSIAIFPLVASHFWHHNFGKISLAWALIFGVPYLAIFQGKAFYDILHIYLLDYVPFIVLLWGLYVAAGGILVRGSIRGTPPVNLSILLIGTAIASWIGTTGASMLLIRPLLRANAYRKNKVHLVVFFIFLVSNIGGSLTPLGDPPLFLGFLHGVPFFWTFTLFPHMLVVSLMILAIFFIFDTIMFRREGGVVPDDGVNEPIRIEGLVNLVFLMGVMGAVLMSGTLKLSELNILGVHVPLQNILRELIILSVGFLSLKFTADEIRNGNEFTWFPIVEVAKLFAGIFMTIIPALAILKAGENGALAGLVRLVKEPTYYFWVTGGLSSFLDNAPTYLTFFNTALGQLGLPESEVPRILAEEGHQFTKYLTAISCGAVFMGANTYIGNAPNFMVRSIAEEGGVKMPSFFGYMVWSIAILVPLFVIINLIFF